jgi:rsbT antagonist protein RsbS
MLAEQLGGRETRGVVLEISACEVIDIDEFSRLLKLIQMVEWLGLVGIIAGLRPGLVAYLVSAGVSVGTVRTALDLEQALFEIEPTSDV